MFRFKFKPLHFNTWFYTPVIQQIKIEEQMKTVENKLAEVHIKNNSFAAEYGDKYKSMRSGVRIHKNGKDYHLLNQIEETDTTVPDEGNNENNPAGEDKPDEEEKENTVIWEAEFQVPAKEYSVDYTAISGVVADDISDETANGGDDWDGHDRTIALYFVGCVNEDGTEKRLGTPYLMDWADPRTTQNETMQAYLKEQGFDPYYNAPGACYNIDTDAKAIITAAYSVNLIFKIVRLKNAVNNATVTAE